MYIDLLSFVLCVESGDYFSRAVYHIMLHACSKCSLVIERYFSVNHVEQLFV